MTRWGILATGGIAAKFAADLALLPDAELAAVGSRTAQAARRFATEHGFARAHGSWAELAADPEVDVVYVATPHSAHHQAAKLCLAAGKAVLCEKPLTLDLVTARDLVDTAASAGVFLMEAMWMRTNPAIRQVQELVADGAIGAVTAVLADFGFAAPVDAGHRLHAPELGGGALLDLGVYPIHLAHTFLGAPDRVQAVATLSGQGVDLNTGIVLGYPSGAVASLHCGLVGDTPSRASVVGTHGRIELPGHFHRPSGFTLVRRTGREHVGVPYRGNGLGYEAQEVMRCLAEGRVQSPLVPWQATLDVTAIMDEVRDQIGLVYPG